MQNSLQDASLLFMQLLFQLDEFIVFAIQFNEFNIVDSNQVKTMLFSLILCSNITFLLSGKKSIDVISIFFFSLLSLKVWLQKPVRFHQEKINFNYENQPNNFQKIENDFKINLTINPIWIVVFLFLSLPPIRQQTSIQRNFIEFI